MREPLTPSYENTRGIDPEWEEAYELAYENSYRDLVERYAARSSFNPWEPVLLVIVMLILMCALNHAWPWELPRVMHF